MEQAKVSVIVPVYKVEKYLRRSMDSLVNQTLDGVEVICINDGSPDNCLSILKEYQEKHSNVVIIDKPNEGVWKGRFDGIHKATGEYIAFVDSDDYRVDVETEHVYSTEMTGFANKKIDMNVNPEDILIINTAMWNKLYKAEVLKNMKNLQKPPRILDDMMFWLLACLNVKTISFIDNPLYYYMVRGDSIMAQIKKEQIESTEQAMVDIKNIYKEDENGKGRLEIIDSMAFLHFGISLMYRMSSDKANFKNVLKENRQYLDREFSSWKTTKYLKLCYCIAHKGSNLKVAIRKKIYVLHMLGAFLAVYNWILKTFKIDIKW